MLKRDELSDQEKKAITQNITRQVMLNLGYIPNQTKTIYTDETGRDGKQIMGFYSLQTGRSYINIKNNESTKDLVATSATESQRAMDHQRGIDFLQNEDNHSTYSQNFGNAVARYYGYALSSYGSGYGSAKINNRGSINQNYYASNNKEFSRLDKQKGANRINLYNPNRPIRKDPKTGMGYTFWNEVGYNSANISAFWSEFFDDTTLYVDGHGGYGIIGDEGDDFTPAQFYEQKLVFDPTWQKGNVKVIEIRSCYAGAALFNSNSFAQELANIIYEKDYRKDLEDWVNGGD